MNYGRFLTKIRANRSNPKVCSLVDFTNATGKEVVMKNENELKRIKEKMY